MKRLLLGTTIGAAIAYVLKEARRRKLLPEPPRPADVVERVTDRWGGGDDLEALTKEQLYERAQAEGIPGRSDMTKDQLIQALRAKRSESG